MPESISRKSNVKDKMQLSLLKQQYQLDYESRVKSLIQNQILKSNTDMDADSDQMLNVEQEEYGDQVLLHDWDTSSMRQIIRQLMPHGDIVLDDLFFESIRNYKPYMSMGELRDGCLQLLNIIRSQRDGMLVDGD